MDMKEERIKPACLRRIVNPRCNLTELTLFRLNSVNQHKATRHWKNNVVKSTIRKYIHREKKRAHLAKQVRKEEEIEGMIEITHDVSEEPISAGGFICRPPPGAMAPANTTQYLMCRYYEDFQPGARVINFPAFSQQSIDTTTDREEACLCFQQRDFEEQFGALW